MKRIRLSKHAQEQAVERGTTRAEVEEAVRKVHESQRCGDVKCAAIISCSTANGRAKITRLSRSRPLSKKRPMKPLSLPSIHFTFKHADDENQLRSRD